MIYHRIAATGILKSHVDARSCLIIGQLTEVIDSWSCMQSRTRFLLYCYSLRQGAGLPVTVPSGGRRRDVASTFSSGNFATAHLSHGVLLLGGWQVHIG